MEDDIDVLKLRIDDLEQKLVKVFALLDEHHSKITGFISWTDQAPRASEGLEK